MFNGKEKNEKVKKNKKKNIGTIVRALVFDARLLATSQFASGRSCDQSTPSSFFVIFLGPRANTELVSKLHVALHAPHVTVQW
jgi:hypothetical protein